MIDNEMMARLEKRGAVMRPPDPVATSVDAAAERICCAVREAADAAAAAQVATTNDAQRIAAESNARAQRIAAEGMAEMARKLVNRPTYRFEIKRSKDGLIESVTARPE